MSRICVLCVDALEYDFIEPRDFNHLKQRHYGKIEIPKEYGETITWTFHKRFKPRQITTPFTPTIWATILTGDPPSVHGYTRGKASKEKVIPIIGKVFHKRYKTFIDFAHKPIVITLPFRGYGYAISKKWVDSKTYMKEAWYNFNRVKEITLKKLSGEWDLFVTYFKLLDHAGHFFWRNTKVMSTYYRFMESAINEIRERLGSKVLTLIVSDHGMEPLEGIKFQGGQHSWHSFVSTNESDLPSSLLDIHGFVVKRLKQ